MSLHTPSANSNRATGSSGEVPAAVVTVTTTRPAAWDGATAVIWRSESTVKLDAGVSPNRTALAPVRPVPPMMTLVPPVTGPPRDRRESTSGAVGDELIFAANASAKPPLRGWKALLIGNESSEK